MAGSSTSGSGGAELGFCWICAGTPTATAPAGTSLSTTAFAPTCAPSPIHMGPSTFAPAPMTTWSPTVGCRLPRFIVLPPSVAPWNSTTSSPTTAVSPTTTPMPWSMNSRRPIVAPGWISTPVTARDTWDSSRAGSRSAGSRHIRCATRCTHTACRPGYARATSTRDRAAGSRRCAASRSSRRVRANRRRLRQCSPAPVAPVAVRSAEDARAGVGTPRPPGQEVGVQDGGEVALAERRDDHDDQLPGVLGALAELDRGVHGGAGGDADEQPLLLRGPARDGDGGVGVHVDDLVVDVGVEDLRDEVRPDALDLVRAGLAAVEDRRLGRLDAHDLHAGLALLEHLADARDRAAGADARDEDVDAAVGVRPDLLGGGAAVDLRVGLVGELAGEDRARALRDDLVRAVDGALHALGRRGEDQLGAVRAEQRAALLRHGLRHGEHDVVAAGRADERERDARVARGRLHDRAAGPQLARALRRVDDRDADAVLHRAGGVVELELADDRRVDALGQLVDPHQRGVADELRRVVVDACHVSPSLGVAAVQGERRGARPAAGRGRALARGAPGSGREPACGGAASALQTATAGRRGRSRHGVRGGGARSGARREERGARREAHARSPLPGGRHPTAPTVAPTHAGPQRCPGAPIGWSADPGAGPVDGRLPPLHRAAPPGAPPPGAAATRRTTRED